MRPSVQDGRRYLLQELCSPVTELLELRAAKFQSLNAAENMKSYADMAVEHSQNVQRLAAAFESVYNVMSLDQKKLADAVFRERAEQRQQRHRS